MTTAEIASQIVAYVRNKDDQGAYKNLYSPKIISRESQAGEFQVCNGIEELQKKYTWWTENFELHETKASDPLVADDYFSVVYTMDVTHKPSGQRSTSSELAVYKVDDGKIAEEQFFYVS